MLSRYQCEVQGSFVKGLLNFQMISNLAFLALFIPKQPRACNVIVISFWSSKCRCTNDEDLYGPKGKEKNVGMCIT